MNVQRICVQKILPSDQKLVHHIHNKDLHASLQTQKLSAAFYVSKLWKKRAVITCKFVGDADGDVDPPRSPISTFNNKNGRLDPLQKELEGVSVKKAIKRIVKERIEPFVNLTFKFVDKNEDAFVRIGFDETDGAWSLLGTDHKKSKDKTTMNLGWFDIPTTIHEFGHVIGMIHEHQNPSGGIQWDKPAVYEWAEDSQGWDKNTTNTNIIKKYDHNLINGSLYDPCSIMLYFFPGDLTISGRGTTQNTCLSGTDVEWMNNMYNNNSDVNGLYENMYDRTLSNDLKVCPLGRKEVSKVFSVNLYLVTSLIICGLVIIYFVYNKYKRKKRYR